MIRVIGIDPGTVSFDVCGLEGDRLFMDRTIPSSEISASPGMLVTLLESAGPVDLIVGPSGYGLPWVKAADITAGQMKLMVLGQKRDQGRDAIIGGMNRMLLLLKESGLPIYFAPGLIHLSTIPAHRKVNRIDMGTADKLCALALGVWDQSRHLKIGFNETSFVYVELGGAFTAVMGVEKGKVVDGLGGHRVVRDIFQWGRWMENWPISWGVFTNNSFAQEAWLIFQDNRVCRRSSL